MDDLHLSPMHKALLSHEVRAHASLGFSIARKLMNAAIQQDSTLTNLERINNMVTRTNGAKKTTFTPNQTQTNAPSATLPQLTVEQTIALAEAVKTLKAYGFSVDNMTQAVSGALDEATIQRKARRPMILVENNIRWTRVGNILFLAINCNGAQVTEEKYLTYEKLYTRRGHGKPTLMTPDGVSVTITVGKSAKGGTPEEKSQIDPKQLAAAVLDLPLTAIADCIAVYRKDEGQTA
jgi:hypothetical protein